MRRTSPLALLVATSTLLAACGDDSDSDDAGATTGGNDTTDEAESAADTGEGGTTYPLTVDMCGTEWTYEAAPQNVVTTEAGMLDLLLLLDLDDHVAGFFENDPDNLLDEVSDQAADLDHLGDAFPFPTLEAVLDGQPDLVMSYGFNPEAGFTAERLSEQGINNFTWTESCEGFDGENAVDTFFDDVRTVGEIFDVSDRAEALITDWEARIDTVAENAPDEPVRVLNTGSGDPTAPFASGGLGVGHEIIVLAGGENVFEDIDQTWFEPSWEEVVDRDPELIVEHSGLELDGLRDHLNGNSGLSGMAAVEDDHLVGLRYQESVAGPQLFEGLETMAAAVAEVRA